MNKFLKYKESLYKELVDFHKWDDEARQELIQLLVTRRVNKTDAMMEHVFDYAFKCGIKHAIALIENKGEIK